MPRTFFLAAVLLGGLGAVGAGEHIHGRLETLVERWRGGDEAARAGVVAETQALGAPAIAALFERIATPAEAADPEPAGEGLELPQPPSWPAAPEGTAVLLELGFLSADGSSLTDASRFRVLGPADATASAEGATLVSAPRLTVFDRQRASVSIVQRTTEGTQVDVRPTVAPAHDRVSLALRVACRGSAGGGAALVRSEAALALELQDGGTAVLLLPQPGGGATLLRVKADVVVLDRVADVFPGEEIELID